MKAVKVLLVIVLSLIVVAGAVAQVPATPQAPTQTPQEPPNLQIVPTLGYTFQQQRGGRGGGPAGGPPTENRVAIDQLLVAGARGGGAWWTNTNLISRLGITDEQKARIERAYENHRQGIAAATALLEKEEVQLGRLLEAEPLDKNAVLSQIDRVVHARGEVERTSAAMTLEMREQLTRAQWMQLPQQNQPRGTFTTGRPYTTNEAPAGGRTGGGQRQPAPRSGGGQRQQ